MTIKRKKQSAKKIAAKKLSAKSTGKKPIAKSPYQRPRRSAKSPVLFVLFLIGLGVLLGLGNWQVNRLQWKNELQEIITSRQAEPVLTLPLPAIPFDELYYRSLTLKGKWLHEHEILLLGKYYGKELGYHILTPFQTKEGSVFLVNRGWIPDEIKEHNTRPETLVSGNVEITGILHAGDTPRFGSLLPGNKPEKNEWLWTTIPQLSRTFENVGIRIEPVVVIQTNEEASLPLPRRVPIHTSLRNDHLEYAITWFSLAVILVVMYVIYRRKGNV